VDSAPVRNRRVEIGYRLPVEAEPPGRVVPLDALLGQPGSEGEPPDGARGFLDLPGASTPQLSGPLLAAIALDDEWAHLRDGAFVVKSTVTDVQPIAHDRDRERRLWEATAELLERAGAPR